MKVNWDDDIPNILENKIHGNQTTNQWNFLLCKYWEPLEPIPGTKEVLREPSNNLGPSVGHWATLASSNSTRIHILGGFHKWGYPQIILRGFSFYKPSIFWGYPHDSGNLHIDKTDPKRPSIFNHYTFGVSSDCWTALESTGPPGRSAGCDKNYSEQVITWLNYMLPILKIQCQRGKQTWSQLKNITTRWLCQEQNTLVYYAFSSCSLFVHG